MKHPGMVAAGALIQIVGMVLVITVSWRLAWGLFLIWFANVLLQASKR